MKNSDIKEALKRYMNKSYSKEDLFLLQESLNNAEDKSLDESLLSIWSEHIGDEIEDQIKSDIFLNIGNQLNLYDKPKAKKIPLKRFIFAVASIVLLLVFNFSLVKYFEGKGNTYTERSLVVQTNKDDKTNIYLPDSSVIILSESTKLEYPPSFGETNRTINFLGKAYFKVARNEKSTFTVNVENSKVEVLGTEFNIDAAFNVNADWKDVIEVSLVTGSVKITPDVNRPEHVFLEPGNKAIYNKVTGELVVEEISTREIAWLNKKLVFNAVSLDQILVDLGKTYGVYIPSDHLPEKLLNDKFTAVFDNRSLEEILDILTKYYRFNYRIGKDKVTISLK